MKGLEPPRLSALDPKSSAATNYATSAVCAFLRTANLYNYFIISHITHKKNTIKQRNSQDAIFLAISVKAIMLI